MGAALGRGRERDRGDAASAAHGDPGEDGHCSHQLEVSGCLNLDKEATLAALEEKVGWGTIRWLAK